jgi:hypothetical protein
VIAVYNCLRFRREIQGRFGVDVVEMGMYVVAMIVEQ